MHIADLTMFYAPESGGIKRYLSAKCNWLRLHAGYRHSLIVPAHPGQPLEGDRHEVSQVRLKSFPLAAGYRVPYVPGAAGRAISALRPDIVEVADPFHLAWEAAGACRRSSIPMIAFCHSDVPEVARRLLGPAAGSAAARYLRCIYDKFDLVLAPSAYMAGRLCKLGLQHVRVQPLGVDTDIFRPRESGRLLRERLHIERGARLLAFAGRFAREKNLHVLAQAMRLLGPRYVLIAVGSGPLRPQGSNVRVIPYTQDARILASIISAADLFVHAGDQETFGLSALEALSCGVPVVGMRAGGVGELLDDEIGALAPPRDPQALARAVREIAERDQQSLRAAARRRAVTRYDWNIVLPQLVGHYRALGVAPANSSREDRVPA